MTRRIESAEERSVPRVAWAVALVFAPAWSAAVAAWSAPVRAVAMARSAWTIATWPKTPAPPWLAEMLSFDATAERSCWPRSVMRPPRFSTASVSIRVPRPAGAPPGEEDGVGGGDDGGLSCPPWCADEPRPVRGRVIRWRSAARHRA
ncbi:hypothetical protein JOD54_004293 [Actinokineospora baliensis]|uniref:hypothetical protein n=1 Tax=Actinokineospora baliensis TaxID=547056 RepID=UPI00195D5DB5|nr:hypothetical protein [Actinokineospora baliensis]MBM7774089.1 hypothetical protein [Actinokineospora baliensis]